MYDVTFVICRRYFWILTLASKESYLAWDYRGGWGNINVELEKVYEIKLLDTLSIKTLALKRLHYVLLYDTMKCGVKGAKSKLDKVIEVEEKWVVYTQALSYLFSRVRCPDFLITQIHYIFDNINHKGIIVFSKLNQKCPHYLLHLKETPKHHQAKV